MKPKSTEKFIQINFWNISEDHKKTWSKQSDSKIFFGLKTTLLQIWASRCYLWTELSVMSLLIIWTHLPLGLLFWFPPLICFKNVFWWLKVFKCWWLYLALVWRLNDDLKWSDDEINLNLLQRFLFCWSSLVRRLWWKPYQDQTGRKLGGHLCLNHNMNLSLQYVPRAVAYSAVQCLNTSK